MTGCDFGSEVTAISAQSQYCLRLVACSGEHGVDAVAIAALEIVATHAVIALQVANDGFDGGAECMAIIWVTVQRLGVQHELPPWAQ
jgi:hypothetical protein